MKSPHLIDAFWKILKKRGEGVRGDTREGERSTNGRMRCIPWLGSSHLICSHLLNRIFQGLYVPFRERLKYNCTWSPTCSTSVVVAERQAGISEQNGRELQLLRNAGSLLPMLNSTEASGGIAWCQGPVTVPAQQEKVLPGPVACSETGGRSRRAGKPVPVPISKTARHCTAPCPVSRVEPTRGQGPSPVSTALRSPAGCRQPDPWGGEPRGAWLCAHKMEILAAWVIASSCWNTGYCNNYARIAGGISNKDVSEPCLL